MIYKLKQLNCSWNWKQNLFLFFLPKQNMSLAAEAVFYTVRHLLVNVSYVNQDECEFNQLFWVEIAPAVSDLQLIASANESFLQFRRLMSGGGGGVGVVVIITMDTDEPSSEVRDG